MTRLEKKNYILLSGEKGVHPEIQYSIIHAKNHPFSSDFLSKYCITGSVLIFPDDYFLYSFLDHMPADMRYFASESSPVQKSKFWIDVYEGNIPILV